MSRGVDDQSSVLKIVGMCKQRVEMYNVHGTGGVVSVWKCTMFMVQGGVVRQRVEMYNVHGTGGVVSVWKCTNVHGTGGCS